MSPSTDLPAVPAVAIVGMACRFPGAADVHEFWRNLRDGVESISTFSDEELLAAGVDPALLRDPSYVRAGGVVADSELFDAAFFDFNPREAEILDPQQRLFLECAWTALEAAGYGAGDDRPVAVFAGASFNTYVLYNLYGRRELIETVGWFQSVIGNDKDFLASRVAYKLNLRGPAVTVQTACSTSLVAVHLACQGLLGCQFDMALAGGVSVFSPAKAGYLYQEGEIRSPDGHCRAFDARARGTVGGTGAGIVVLKRLEDALADGDHIHAVIRGTAINNDGSDKVGYSAPGVAGQAEVIQLAQEVAGVAAGEITYVEAHGSGTELGDRVEVAALTEAFRATTSRRGFCALGSVKTNIGHLDVAAGVAGLIKTVLALEHRLIPPSLHFETPNPAIDFGSSPFQVNARLADWAAESPRRAGVSSFGLGGTNAHAVLEEAPAPEPHIASPRPWHLFVLSARTTTALDAATANLAGCLRSRPGLDPAGVAFTLRAGRRRFRHRRFVVTSSLEDAAAALEARDPRRLLTAERDAKAPAVVFMLPGGGAQHPDMARGLYAGEPVFRAEVDRGAEILALHLGLDLRTLMYPPPEQRETAAGQLRRPSLGLPALFLTEYALARLWISWGIRPVALIGHSMGEYVAACLAGVFSLADALSLVLVRGRLFEKLPRGAMLGVSLSEG
ncbi:MAG TPA: type I polyketide synthase, partial [Thermoanaerobaculia bacterium]|nr:type I polyketide synthase [Thermoanaerobaculia bacterium]